MQTVQQNTGKHKGLRRRLPKRELSSNQGDTTSTKQKPHPEKATHVRELKCHNGKHPRDQRLRQTANSLGAKWEKAGIDIALLSEVQKNTGGMEKEGQWGKYTVFFSTGINPKKREELEQNREKKACETKKRNRKKKGKVEPAPKPKQRREERNQPNRGQGNNASKRDADYEHAGVAIAVHRKLVKLMEEVREISGRNMTVILKTGSGDLALTATYRPTAEGSEKTKTCTGKNYQEKWRRTKTASELSLGTLMQDCMRYKQTKDDASEQT